MNLYDALALIAKNASLDYVELCAYADEDHEGGRGAYPYDAWSIDADEGRLLYALARALKPARVLEIGVRQGASTAHLLAGLYANDGGELFSYDIENGAEHGERARWQFRVADALADPLIDADLVFEDSKHSLDYSLTLYRKLRELSPRVVVVHDYDMTEAHGDFHVREAFDTVFPEGFPLTLDGCERGLAVWVNPVVEYKDFTFEATTTDTEAIPDGATVIFYDQEPTKSTAHKPTRKPRTKTTTKRAVKK